jgi:kinesin family protein C2/C3
MFYNYRQKAPSRIARLFLAKNGQPANPKPKPRESALKPPGTLET